jgi:Zn-dependent M28 family amino/carboxypeptidase
MVRKRNRVRMCLSVDTDLSIHPFTTVHLLRRSLLVLFIVSSAGRVEGQITERFIEHATYLSSDELEGRAPGTEGSALAASYIQTQFSEAGLESPYGSSYYQEITLVESGLSERNVVGVIRANEPTDRSLVFTAHFDAYGIVEEDGANDVVYNGARDNAIGVAALIELARMYSGSDSTNQNLVFIATTAEEDGLVGSKYYVDHPLYPFEDISMVINIDGFNVSGPRTDYFVMPRQGVDYVDQIVHVAGQHGWAYAPPDWIDGMNTSFDTAAFLSRGVPAITIWTGDTVPEDGHRSDPQFGSIHSATDEINDTWDWSGVEAHLHLYKAIADYFLTAPKSGSITDPGLFLTE